MGSYCGKILSQPYKKKIPKMLTLGTRKKGRKTKKRRKYGMTLSPFVRTVAV